MFHVRRTGAALLAVGVLSSCTAGADGNPPEPPPALDAATTEYTAAYDDVVGALTRDIPEVEWTAKDRFPHVAEQPDGRCVLFLAESLGEGDLYEPSGGLTELAAVLDPVLDEHGFDPVSEVVYPESGGDVYVTATDPAGWELTVGAYPPIVGLSGPVETDRCDESALG
ncbi:hypothetical protein [Myceligenerans pegani]|uniref:Lipoprotein n=1 Tax=Myceligenerans pegani TaxID=2776917 RepID=A0ABR9MY55_9MICO|nr:hypothetical protein [Myceligenerans sp. TRM 65318]MBE1876302.1 hypothetical protein [Myceligenerans sp. TRM 65318]MBE3018573.1 hypothetical protein [Myceligenerans sp. TRM 65318]